MHLPRQLEVPCEGMISTCQYDQHLKPTNHQLIKNITSDPKKKYLHSFDLYLPVLKSKIKWISF